MTNLINGDARHIALADESVQCIITSPPYFGLRDYGTARWEGGEPGCKHAQKRPIDASTLRDDGRKNIGTQPYEKTAEIDIPYRNTCPKCGAHRIDSQIGLEAQPDCLGWATGQPCGKCYVCTIVAVMRECKRVLRNDGTVWLNLGDSYAGGAGGRGDAGRNFHDPGMGGPASQKHNGERIRRDVDSLKPKDLCLIPARVALALQAAGWYVRSEIVWHKPNPMPESVTDRPTKAHEMIYLLTKRAEYYYDAEAIKESSTGQVGTAANFARDTKEADIPGQARRSHRLDRDATCDNGSRNRRSVWTIATSPYSGAHFATFPPALIEPMILAGTSARGACPTCGKAWVRIIDKGLTAHDGRTESAYQSGTTAHRMSLLRQAARERGEEYTNNTTTLGFAPACRCYAGIPAAPALPEMPDDAIAPKPCDRCGGTGQIESLPMFSDTLSNVCPMCSGTGGRAANKIWIKWRKQWEKINAERIAVYELIKDMDLPVVPCVVFDPFVGSGTVLRVAIKHGRTGIGNDLNINYASLAVDRESNIQRVMPL